MHLPPVGKEQHRSTGSIPQFPLGHLDNRMMDMEEARTGQYGVVSPCAAGVSRPGNTRRKHKTHTATSARGRGTYGATMKASSVPTHCERHAG